MYSHHAGVLILKSKDLFDDNDIVWMSLGPQTLVKWAPEPTTNCHLNQDNPEKIRQLEKK